MVQSAVVLYAVAMLVTAGLSAALAVWLWRVRERTTVTRLGVVVVLGAVGEASLTLARVVFGQTTTGPELMALTFRLGNAVSFVSTAAFLLFALYFTGRTDLLTRPVWVGLAVASVVPAGLVVTNPLHGLMHLGYGVDPDPFVRLTAEKSWLYDLSTTANDLLTYAAMALFLQFGLSSRRVNRTQFFVLLLVPVPGLALLYAGSFGILVANVNYSSIASTLSLLLIGWALFRRDAFAVDPVARDTVVTSARDGVLTVDRWNRVTDFNHAAVEQFPALDDGVGDRLGDVVPALVTDPEADAPDRFAGEVERYDGDERLVFDVAVSPVTVAGQTRGYSLTLRDVTARRERATQLERETEQLDRFVSTVSHDLRNPLSVAQGYLQVADGDDEALDEVETALDRMDDLIDDALTLAREGRAVEERVFVALDDLARDAWRTSRTAAATLTVTAPEGTRVYADGDRLLRLFENLFRNAIDHGPEDVTVRVGLLGDATDADGGFYVEDTGPGIPVDERETVFEHGYTTSADGTGLGLAIVESVAEAHGWTVTAAESPEGGARFVFEGAEVDVVSRAPGDAVAEDRDGGDGGELLIEEG